jgi:hypothetical protein
MDWKEVPRYSGFLIWVGLSPNGRWVASVAALPQRGVMPTAGPGEQMVPGDYATEEEAAKVARKYIWEKHRQRKK